MQNPAPFSGNEPLWAQFRGPMPEANPQFHRGARPKGLRYHHCGHTTPKPPSLTIDASSGPNPFLGVLLVAPHLPPCGKFLCQIHCCLECPEETSRHFECIQSLSCWTMELSHHGFKKSLGCGWEGLTASQGLFGLKLWWVACNALFLAQVLATPNYIHSH